MSWIKESLVFAGLAVICALGMYLVHGEYDRSVPCDPSEMAEHEVCLSTVMDEWKGEVVWVDARAAEEKEKKLRELNRQNELDRMLDEWDDEGF